MIIRGQAELANLSDVSLQDYIYIYPTDTVWGIGAPITNQKSHQLIAKIKGTQATKALSLLFSSLSQLKSWMSFPAKMNEKWLKNFFEMESTLAIPRYQILKDIAEYIVPLDSKYVAMRMLAYPFLDFVTISNTCPITTTSLNKTGWPPMVLENDAMKFYEDVLNITDKIIFFAGMGVVSSGHSSTILCLEDNKDIKIWREGQRVKEIEKHLQLLPA